MELILLQTMICFFLLDIFKKKLTLLLAKKYGCPAATETTPHDLNHVRLSRHKQNV